MAAGRLKRCMPEDGKLLTNLTSLPHEILEHILSDNVLEHTDIKSVACTCLKLRDAAYNNEVWKTLVNRRWPKLIAKYPRGKTYIWRHEYLSRDCCGRLIREKLAAMSALYFHKEDLCIKLDLMEFSAMLMQHEHADLFVVDELMNVLHCENRDTDLTIKYYAQKVLRHIQQIRLRQEFQQFLKRPQSKMNLEEGAVLIAQWCQPSCDITINGITDQLDSIAQMVEHELRQSHPKHPYLSRDLSQPDPVSSSFTPTHQRQLLNTLNVVLFKRLHFIGNTEDYYDPRNSYINQVLERKTGIPISLAVIYLAISRRLGVKCESVNFPSHFFLKWRENPELDSTQQYTFIDVFNRGQFMSQHDCALLLPFNPAGGLDSDIYKSVPTRVVLARMVRNLVAVEERQIQSGGSGVSNLLSNLELGTIISPDDLETRIRLCRICIHQKINIAETLEHLQNIASFGRGPAGLLSQMMLVAERQLKEEKSVPKIMPRLRSDNPQVQFSVGMIMKHRRYHYKCVIYGWDKECMASPPWMSQMGVPNLPNGQYQPFYNVLVHDGSTRYAAHDNLEFIEEPCVITHSEIGRYFHSFCGTHYEMNEEKCQEYPQDAETTVDHAHTYYQHLT